MMPYVEALAAALQKKSYGRRPIGVEIDTRDIGGARGWDWIKKGIPLRVEIGPRDIAAESVFVGRRDRDHREKVSYNRERFVAEITDILDEIQHTLFDRALGFERMHSTVIDEKKSFYDYFTPSDTEKPEIHGGFAYSHWCGDTACEAAIKEDLGVTIRCIPFPGTRHDDSGPGRCIACGEPSPQRVVFAKAY